MEQEAGGGEEAGRFFVILYPSDSPEARPPELGEEEIVTEFGE